jgi:hypothetical protein
MTNETEAVFNNNLTNLCRILETALNDAKFGTAEAARNAIAGMCLARQKLVESYAVSAAGVRDKPGLSLNPTAVVPDCLLDSVRADAAKIQQSQSEMPVANGDQK